MTIDVSLIPQNRVENLLSKLSEIENNIGNIGTDITNNVVHKNGDETISGLKIIENNIFLKDTQGTIGTSTNQWARRIQFADSTGERIARLEPLYFDATTLQMGMYASNGTTTESGIWVRNTGETYAPHPTTAQDSSNKIATTAWVNNLDNSVVHKAGNETINGVKTFSGASRITYLKSTVIDRTTPPSSGYQYAFIDVIDKNNNRLGVLGSQIGPDGKYGTYLQAGNEANIYVKSDGRNGYFEFPRCTTAATTTSTAANDKVAVVVQNYKSGTSWYRVWSDGWIEQGGSWGTNTGAWAEASVTYLKAYKDTNYQLFVQGNWTSAECSSCKITSRSTAGFTGTYANNLYSVMPSWWYACGY